MKTAFERNMDYLPGVETSWALQYIDYALRLNHFLISTDVYSVTPRLIKIVVKRPHTILNKLHEDCVFREVWEGCRATHVGVAVLEHGRKCFYRGMTPLAALQQRYANAADGEENILIGREKPNTAVALTLSWCAVVVALLAAAIKY